MADNKYKVIPTAATELAQYEKYSAEDTNLIESFGVNSAFDSQKHVSELHIYTVGNTLLRSISSYTNYKIELGSGGSKEGSSTISVDPEKDAIAYGYRNGGVKLLYIFFNNLFSEAKLGPKLYIKEISNDRTELKLSSTGILNEDLKKYALAIKDRIEDTSFFSEFRLNLGNNELFIGINIDYSDEEEVVTVKLYEPLPISVGLKATLDVCEFVSDPIAYEIEAEFTPDAPTIPRLREANFNIDLEDNTSTPSQYFNYDELFSYSVDNSNYQVYSLFNEKGAELSIDHTNYEDFIHFSSAEERLINFKYKLDLLNNYSSSIQNINSELGSSGVTSDKQYYENLIEGIVNNFDHYERFLYFESGSNSWPKANGKKPYVNLESSNSEAITWFTSQRTAANNYDVSNFNALTNTIPAFIREDDNNAQYTLFVQMIAQHFDNLWIYSKAVSDKYNADNRLNVGVSRDLVEEAIKSLGVKLYNSSNSLEDLFKYFVGEFTQDTGEGINENVQAGNIVTRTKEVIGTKEIQVPVEVTEGEYTGLAIKLRPSYTRVTIEDYPIFFRGFLKDPDKRHPFENPDVDRENITPAQFRRFFEPSYPFSVQEISDLMEGYPKIVFTNGLTPESKELLSNPENLQRFETLGIFYATFTFSNDRTDPVTGEVVPAGTYGPYKFKKGQTSFTGNRTYDKSQMGRYPGLIAFKDNRINTFLNNPSFEFSARDFDGNWLGILFRAGTTRDYTDTNPSITSGLFRADDLEVEVVISDTPDVVTTSTKFETQEVQTTKTVTEKVVDPFDTLPKDLYQKSVYKRIYHNLPFLLKTKGTQRGLRALINCFGIPYNIMKIRTSGGRLNSERPFFGTELQSSLETSNVRTDNNDTIISGSTLSQFTTITKPEDTYNQDLHNIEVGFSPSDNLNALIVNTLGSTFNVDDYIGDPRDLTADSYNGLLAQVKTALADITEKYDVKDFVRLIKFFDNVVFKMIKDFVPARSTVDTGVIIKPHILDKSKAKSVAVSVTQPEYSGSISIGEYSGSHGGIYQGVATGSISSAGTPSPLPYPLKNSGEYSTSYSELIQTPDGERLKDFFGLKTKNAEQARFDGELRNSEIQLSDGELNTGNPFKKINYPTIKYNIRFLKEPVTDICLLDDKEEFVWFVTEENFQDTSNARGNELDLVDFVGTGAQLFFILEPPNTEKPIENPDGSTSTLINKPTSIEVWDGTTLNQYDTVTIKGKNTGIPNCEGKRPLIFIRCALAAKDPEVQKTSNRSMTNVDLTQNFTGLEVNYDYKFTYRIDNGGETEINDPENFSFNKSTFTNGSIITITVKDEVAAQKGKTCQAAKEFLHTDCAMETESTGVVIKRSPSMHFKYDNDKEDENGNITRYYVRLFTKGVGGEIPIGTKTSSGGNVNYETDYPLVILNGQERWNRLPKGVTSFPPTGDFTAANIVNTIYLDPPAKAADQLTHIRYLAINDFTSTNCIAGPTGPVNVDEGKSTGGVDQNPSIVLRTGRSTNKVRKQNCYLDEQRCSETLSGDNICNEKLTYAADKINDPVLLYYGVKFKGDFIIPLKFMTPQQLYEAAKPDGNESNVRFFKNKELTQVYSPPGYSSVQAAYIPSDNKNKVEDGDSSQDIPGRITINKQGYLIDKLTCSGKF